MALQGASNGSCLLKMIRGSYFQAAVLFATSIVVQAQSPEVLVSSNTNLPREVQTCGGGIGSCAETQCCSETGFCGIGIDYCSGPECQLEYGPACDGNVPPPGESTLNIARPLLGNQIYGSYGIQTCINKGQIALTFDDGPYLYTNTILELLAQYNATATFFITGNNIGKGRIDDSSLPWSTILKRIYDSGHQLASHTWTHQDLNTASRNTRTNQMIYLEMAFRNIFGFFPTYMRPPYATCTSESSCEEDMKELGYHVVYFDIDTKDYLHDSQELIQKSKDIFGESLSWDSGNHKYLSLSHDTLYQTANNLTKFMLETVYEGGYRVVSVGECLGDSRENWYRDAKMTSSSSTGTKEGIVGETKTKASRYVVALDVCAAPSIALFVPKVEFCGLGD